MNLRRLGREGTCCGLIPKCLYEVLTDENELECIEPRPGDRFDSQRHEAMESVPARYLDPGSVAEVMEVGYVFEGKTLRPAKVKVTVESE